MKPAIGVITLAVDDLERSLVFYRDGLGLPTDGVTGTEFPGDAQQPAGDVVMFHLDTGLILALYPRSELAKDAGIALAQPDPGSFSIGHIVPTRAEVDEVLAAARAAGARTAEQPYERAWGMYSGYFADPDGHLWEVITNDKG